MTFQIGDRVAVYSGSRHVGDVIEIHTDGRLTVRVGFAAAMVVHPKQCRKLKERERRRVWVNFYPDYVIGGTFESELEARKWASANTVEVAVPFVEERKK